MTKTIRELVMEYFMDHPHQDLPHGPVVDWVSEQYSAEQGKMPRDPWRTIRQLHQEGKLIKAQKGIYRYDPDAVIQRTLEDFTPQQKQEILERDGCKCVVCGRGTRDGVELHIDHIKPRNLGGRATIENGQTLCAQHNFIKKSFKQTETGKKMFIRLYELANAEGNEQLTDFCTDILKTYEQHDINGHIEWKR